MRRTSWLHPLFAAALGIAVAVAGGAACGGGGDALCAPVPVQRPVTDEPHAWTEDGYATLTMQVGNDDARVLLDTGFPLSVVTPKTAQSLDAERGLELRAGTMHAGPLPVRLVTAALGVDAVAGADVLGAVPHRHDARARTTTFAATTSDDAAMPAVPLERLTRGPACERRALRLPARVEGRDVFLLLDTGAHATFLRSDLVSTSDGRATLTGLPVQSGFAGVFTATATRARELSVGSSTARNTLVLTAPEVDRELDRLSQDYGRQVDGFLGWTYLREFEVDLTGSSTLRLARFDTQAHWTREFVGIGILRGPSVDPPGVRVGAFLSNSPARDAGLLEGDVITHVDGQPAEPDGPLPPPASGDTVELTVRRGTEPAPRSFSVRYADLLPDPR